MQFLAMLIAVSPMQASPVLMLEQAIIEFPAACGAGANREDFDAYAASHGWTATPRTPQPPRDWISVYRKPSAELRLSHYPASYQPADSEGVSRESREQTSCSLEFLTDATTWQATIPQMFIGGTSISEAEPIDTSQFEGGPPGMTVKGWRLGNSSEVFATYIPQRGTLELSINYFPEP
jgi:hypothetical protein